MDAVTLLAELKERGARIELLPEDRFAVQPASLIDAPLRDSSRGKSDKMKCALLTALGAMCFPYGAETPPLKREEFRGLDCPCRTRPSLAPIFT
jgi:hypothetical protein